jgi:16S rRNA (guanine527-N7)-methyltransferase
MEFCVTFIKVGGHFVCLKGPNANLELEESKAAMEALGIEFVDKIDVELPETDLNHNILVFKKVKNTPDKYPRKAGKPSKTPIK